MSLADERTRGARGGAAAGVVAVYGTGTDDVCLVDGLAGEAKGKAAAGVVTVYGAGLDDVGFVDELAEGPRGGAAAGARCSTGMLGAPMAILMSRLRSDWDFTIA